MAANRHPHSEPRRAEDDDPVLKALLSAPIDDEPLTPADEEALAESDEDIRQGRVMSSAELRRRLGLPPRR